MARAELLHSITDELLATKFLRRGRSDSRSTVRDEWTQISLLFVFNMN